MHAYTGKILYVDLKTGRRKTAEFDEAFARDYIGGTGFGIKMLIDNLKPGIDAFDPQNPLIYVAGGQSKRNANFRATRAIGHSFA